MLNNNLLKFCSKVLILLWIISCVDRLTGEIFVNMKNLGLKNNPYHEWMRTPYTVEEVAADVIIIGSSKASHHYVPEIIENKLGRSVYNCGQDGCYFLYQNTIVNMVLDRYSPQLIIWDIQPSSFLQENSNAEYINMRLLSPYYYCNPWTKKYIDSESENAALKMNSRMYAYNSKCLNYILPIIHKRKINRSGYYPLLNEGYALPVFVAENQPKSYVVSKEYLDILSDTIQRCKENNVDVQLVASPVFSRKCNSTIESLISIDSIAVNNQITFIDMTSSEIFMEDASLFKDVTHLNDKGAHLFTNMLMESIKQ